MENFGVEKKDLDYDCEVGRDSLWFSSHLLSKFLQYNPKIWETRCLKLCVIDKGKNVIKTKRNVDFSVILRAMAIFYSHFKIFPHF